MSSKMVAPQDGVRVTAKTWAARLAPYRAASTGRGLLELLLTLVPLIGLFALSGLAIRHGVWWGLLLIPPAALFLTRLFLIQHDCGHGAFLPDRRLNDWLGRVLGVLTLTPYDYWKRAHALHHATSGALDRRGIGGIDTLTVDEYRALSPIRRVGYCLYRHPAVMFGLGPAFVFLLQNRWPAGMMNDGWRPWVSTMATNLGVAAMIGLIVLFFGLEPMVLIYLPVVVLAASIGVWLFFVQHQFEETYWRREGEWEFHDAAFLSSSHYDLPQPLRWLTANIGVHHVHHLCSRIPFYRLGQVLRDQPALKSVGRLTLLTSARCVWLALWDEAAGRLVSFAEARRMATVA